MRRGLSRAREAQWLRPDRVGAESRGQRSPALTDTLGAYDPGRLDIHAACGTLVL